MLPKVSLISERLMAESEKFGVYYCLYAMKTKKRLNFFSRLCWLGYPDSNQERQDQNLQCYHYTIAQSLWKSEVASCPRFLISGAKVRLF